MERRTLPHALRAAAIVYRIYVVIWIANFVKVMTESLLNEIYVMIVLLQQNVEMFARLLQSLPPSADPSAVQPFSFPRIVWLDFCQSYLVLTVFALPIIIRYVTKPLHLVQRLVTTRIRSWLLAAGLALGAALMFAFVSISMINTLRSEPVSRSPSRKKSVHSNAAPRMLVPARPSSNATAGVLPAGRDRVLPQPVLNVASTTIDGEPWQLSDYKERVVLIDFWASWCAPCIRSLPRLQAIQETFSRDPRFALVTVCIDEKEKDARQTLDRLQLPGLTLFEPSAGWNNNVVRAFRVAAIPHTELVVAGDRGRTIDISSTSCIDTIRQALEEIDPERGRR